ncbi:DUF6980 family protein [Domibacillus indicus]|uniref:DUF6980 family protein n=1 Tax=Domibacillus indicus TaxID=1437523 RepID=UPI0037BEC26D
MKTYCCEDMKYHASFKCNVHENPFDCPDQLVYCDKDGREFGIIIHDGGSSIIAIQYCPWCGSDLD